MITNTIEMTAAKIGPVDEEMRKSHRTPAVLVGADPAELRRHAAVRRGRRACCGVTLAPGRTRISPLTTTVSSGLEARLTTRRPSTRGPSVTYFGVDDVVAVERVDELAHLLGADGRIRHEQRFSRRRGSDLDAPEHAGRQAPVGVGELGAAADGAGRAVDGVVDEVDLDPRA